MSSASSLTKDQILDALRKVRDPETQRDLVSLDRIRNVAACDGYVRIVVELSGAGEIHKDQIRSDIESVVTALGGLKNLDVDFAARSAATPSSAAAPSSGTPSGSSPQAQGQTHGHSQQHAQGHAHGAAHAHGNPMQPVSLSGVKNVIAVGAGKGGVGKSTLSVMLAMGLLRKGYKVGLMDADVYGPSIPKMLGMETARPTMDNDRILPVFAHGLKVMSIGFLVEPDRAIIWRGPMIHGTVKQFLDQVDWAPLDYLIVDLPPGTGDVPLTLSQSIPMTGAVVVCTPQDVALLDAVRAARMYQQLNVDVLGIIENMSYFIAPDTGKEYDLFGKGGAAKAAGKLKVPFLGSIPINIGIRLSGDQGTPTTMFDDHADVAKAATAAVDALVQQVTLRQAAGPSAPAFTVRQ